MSDTRRKRYSGGVKPRSTENGDQSHNNHWYKPKTAQPIRPKTLTHSANKMSGFDHVRKIVQEEGRTARNLVQYSVPLSENSTDTRTTVITSVANSSRRPNSTTRSHSHVTPPPGSRYRHRSSSEMGKSPRSDVGSKKNDLRARYWKYMFDNFQRAVDAIYQTCEQDESIVECKEVIMMLEQSTKDFKALIETLNMMKAYEDSAKEGDRPSAVAWEVRKMSPNKHGPSSPGPGYASAQVKTNLERSGHSWADKVRGARAIDFNSSHPQPSINITGAKLKTPTKSGDDQLPTPEVNIKPEVSMEDTLEDEGWEKVQRGRVRARQSPSQKSTENLAAPTSSAKRNLMRSLSSPDQGKATKTPPKAQQSISEKDLTSTSGDSENGKDVIKDNEKENIPSNSHKVTNNVHITQSSDPNNGVLSVIVDDSLDVNAAVTPNGESPLALSLKDSLELQLQNDIDRALDEEIQLSSELEKAQRKALAYAEQEEESWLKELAREQNSQVEYIDAVSDLATTNSSVESSSIAITDWESLEAAHEAEMSQTSMKSWGDLVIEADELRRTPGHGVHMHEKLSSPSRKRSPTESRRRHEEKQAKAQELREKLMQEKAERLRDLSKKVAEVRTYKEELMRQGKTLLKHKLERAEEKRQSQLKLKARKAHEEEAKANEIAFINSLEAQNRRHEIMSKYQESDARLQEIAEERQRRLEEKQAKEAAVEERRKALEADRKARLISMQEKRKQRDARIEFQQQEKEKERREAVRVKGREREERIAALNAQQEAQKQELQKKIQQKQDETNQRHEEYLQQIRGRAFEMSVMKHSTEDHNDAPKLTPYDHNKICVICNTLISSEVYLLSHLRGKKHQQALKDHNSGMEMRKEEIENFNLKHIIDVPDNSNHPKIVTEKERIKSLKKRCKKLRNRMVSKGQEYESVMLNKQLMVDSNYKTKFQKTIKDLNKYLQAKETGPWPQNKVSALDRALGELVRILDKRNANDQYCFRVLGGFTALSRLLLTIDDITSTQSCVIPPKSLCLVCDVFKHACKNHFENCHYMLFSNKIGALVDHLIIKMNILIPDSLSKPNTSSGASSHSSSSDGGNSSSGDCSLPFDAVCCSMMQVLNTVLTCLSKNNPASNCSEASSERMTVTGDALTTRGNDIVSYIISVGVMDKLRIYLSAVRGPVDGDKNTSDFLLHSLGLLLAITKFMSKRNANVFDKKRPADPTQLISTFEVTELVGIVSLLYGLLLHSGAPARSSESVPKELAPSTLSIIVTGLRLLNHLALLDLEMFQSTLGEEGLSLEFRHITSYLLWYCGHVSAEELMHEVILCVGYFTVLHADNQVIIQSGQPPTVLQQLCSLPFTYFSDPRLVSVLFPTLIACCYNNNCNKDILEQELNSALLSNFIEERYLEGQQAKLLPSTVKKNSKDVRENESRMAFSLRFPSNRWDQCQKYFSIEEGLSTPES